MGKTEIIETNKAPAKAGSVTIKLLYPVEFDGKVYEEITLQRPRGRHIQSLSSEPKMSELLLMATKVSGVSNAVIKEMDAADCITIAEQLGDFLSSGQRIGKF